MKTLIYIKEYQAIASGPPARPTESQVLSRQKLYAGKHRPSDVMGALTSEEACFPFFPIEVFPPRWLGDVTTKTTSSWPHFLGTFDVLFSSR